MKQRIFAVALALCLFTSSQSVAYAYQEIPLSQEGNLTKEPTDGTDTGDDTVTTPATLEEDSSLKDDVSTKEPTDGTDTGDDTVTTPTTPGEDSSLKDDVLTKGPTDGTDIGDDTVTTPTTPGEDSPLKDDVLTKEPTDGTDIGDDKVTAPQEVILLQEIVPTEPSDGLVTHDAADLTPSGVYADMIALKNQDAYKEGTTWTNDTPYSGSAPYQVQGTIGGKRFSAVGCAAFAFILSDKAFGSLSGREYAAGAFSFEDIKVGDILRVNNDSHTVIVLEVSDVGVVIAEGNFNSQVHWGRIMSKNDVMQTTSHYITRYPENYVSPEDPGANESIGKGTLDGGLTWNLTKAGTLTISGQGAMPDFDSETKQPWNANGSGIRKVVIGNGVTNIGANAFSKCGVLSVEIPGSVTAIGQKAFYASSVISVNIPSGVKTIGDSAFSACASLTSIALPTSIETVGSAAFYQCQELKSVTFASGSGQVKLSDSIFAGCYNLTSVKLPPNIDCIGEGMFQGCMMLGKVEIPQSADTIGMRAFASCSRLTTVIIPVSVTNIGTAAFSNTSSLTDIYFTGTEAQWNSINKGGDVASSVSKATIHYNYIPDTDPDPDDGNDDNTPDDNPGNTPDDNPGNTPGDDPGNTPDDNPGNTPGDDPGNTPGDNPGNNPGGDNPGNDPGGNNPGSSSGDNTNNTGSNSNRAQSTSMASSAVNSGMKAVAEAWKPTTLDELKRYACTGRETVQYNLSKDSAYQINVENAMQGPLCFKSFEAVLGDYTIGRTYNIYALSDTTYSTDKEIELTVKIPSAIYREGREYKMICVTKGGEPIVYNDLDNNPETITIKTDKFYAYALIYK